ncbi:hypothetical protein SLEP1_g38545 [Rubroshorea leprosula]|nr:hypothetical protein SLEP1_g38545 [Rubroshorea leprosula]
MNQMADLVQKLSSELRLGLQPACNNFMGFFHVIDWKNLTLEEEYQLPDVSVPVGIDSDSEHESRELQLHAYFDEDAPHLGKNK